MRKLLAAVIVAASFVAGCSSVPRSGYNSVVVDRFSIDETMAEPAFDAKYLNALSGNIQEETIQALRVKNMPAVQECQRGGLQLQGKIASAHSKMEINSRGVINRETEEDNEYTFVVRARLLECGTGRTIDIETMDETDENPHEAAVHLGGQLAKFILYSKHPAPPSPK